MTQTTPRTNTDSPLTAGKLARGGLLAPSGPLSFNRGRTGSAPAGARASTTHNRTLRAPKDNSRAQPGFGFVVAAVAGMAIWILFFWLAT